MNKFILITTLIGVFLHLSSAGSTNCGCAPGLQGPVGRQGDTGIKGEKGDMGDFGLKGLPGFTGLPGAKGARGPQGAPGAEPPYWGHYYPGPRGKPGPPGKCGCFGDNPFYGQQQTPEQPLQPGDYYVTGDDGELNYLNEEYREEYMNSLTTFETTTARPYHRPPPIAPAEHSSSGLYMLGSNNVLIPVSNVNAYDLFATTERPTTTTSTTASPISNNENIYILGPKGSLIPLNALGFNKPYGHNTHFTSNYNKWLRGMLMGDMQSENDEELSPFQRENDDRK